MAYVYLSDGGPEADEYASNYYHFDESNFKAVAVISKMLASTTERDAAFKARFQNICQTSFDNRNLKVDKNKVRNHFPAILATANLKSSAPGLLALLFVAISTILTCLP